MSTRWNITYEDKAGEKRTAVFDGADEKPSLNEAAIALRDEVLGDIVFARDEIRAQSNVTVRLLESYGFKIINIEKASRGA